MKMMTMNVPMYVYILVTTVQMHRGFGLIRPSHEDVPASNASKPHLIPLRRESVPIYRRGKVASFKTSYSGILNVGSPAQEFRVVFDTGSGHVVLPAAECESDSCLVHRRYDMAASQTALPINSDGSIVPEDAYCDQVTIGFGTGQITGEFVRDKVCLGHASADNDNADGAEAHCMDLDIIVAVEMTTQPFKTFQFDGILGLGLSGLALSKKMSLFEMLSGSGQLGGRENNRFGVFLTEGDNEEESEIAIGGHNHERALEPLHWAPVALPDLGYWQVEILAIRVNGQVLDVCEDGTCRGVVDTGTSHLGVPAPFDSELTDLLSRPAGDILDCRLADAPEVVIELPGYNLTLHPFNYMRRLPLREGVTVGSAKGVMLPTQANGTSTNSSLAASAPQPAGAHGGGGAANLNATGDDAGGAEVKRHCKPRIMPTRLPPPLGPKLFILGEPVLHRYYTVYDWASQKVGFSLANSRRNTVDPAELSAQERRGILPKEVDMLLMQESLSVKRSKQVRLPRAAASMGTAGVEALGSSGEFAASPPSLQSTGGPFDMADASTGGEEEFEEATLVQVKLRVQVSLRPRRVGGRRGKVQVPLTVTSSTLGV